MRKVTKASIPTRPQQPFRNNQSAENQKDGEKKPSPNSLCAAIHGVLTVAVNVTAEAQGFFSAFIGTKHRIEDVLDSP